MPYPSEITRKKAKDLLDDSHALRMDKKDLTADEYKKLQTVKTLLEKIKDGVTEIDSKDIYKAAEMLKELDDKWIEVAKDNNAKWVKEHIKPKEQKAKLESMNEGLTREGPQHENALRDIASDRRHLEKQYKKINEKTWGKKNEPGVAKPVGDEALAKAMDKTLKIFADKIAASVAGIAEAKGNSGVGIDREEYKSPSKEDLLKIYKIAKALEMSGKKLNGAEKELVNAVKEADKQATQGMGVGKGAGAMTGIAKGMAKGNGEANER